MTSSSHICLNDTSLVSLTYRSKMHRHADIAEDSPMDQQPMVLWDSQTALNLNEISRNLILDETVLNPYNSI